MFDAVSCEFRKNNLVKDRKINSSKKWFDYECMQAKRNVQKLLNNFRNHRSHENLETYHEAKKSYRKLIHYKKKLFHQQKVESFLADAVDKNSRAFWSRFKDFSPGPPKNIQRNSWFDYFSSLFNPPNASDNDYADFHATAKSCLDNIDTELNDVDVDCSLLDAPTCV